GSARSGPSTVCIFLLILSRCSRRGKHSVHFLVYLVAVRPPWQAKRAFSRLSCCGALSVASKACIFAFTLSRCARRGKQSVNFRVYLVAECSPRQAKCAFSCLSCRGAFAAPSKACIFAFILSRYARRGKQSVHFRVYLVAVRPPRQAKCAFSRLSCRGASAVASKVCIFAFILSRCARRGKQSMNFRVYLVAVRPPRQAKRAFSRLSCRGASAAASKVCIFAFILLRCARRGKQFVHFRVYLVAVRSRWQAKRAFSRLSCRSALAVASKACIFAFIFSWFVRLVVTRNSFTRFLFYCVLNLKYQYIRNS